MHREVIGKPFPNLRRPPGEKIPNWQNPPAQRDTAGEVIIESLRRDLKSSQLLGATMSSVFFVLLLATIFVAKRYPAFFGITAVCQ